MGPTKERYPTSTAALLLPLRLRSISVERVSDGKIIEHWRVTVSLDMMQQLGAISTPEHA